VQFIINDNVFPVQSTDTKYWSAKQTNWNIFPEIRNTNRDKRILSLNKGEAGSDGMC